MVTMNGGAEDGLGCLAGEGPAVSEDAVAPAPLARVHEPVGATNNLIGGLARYSHGGADGDSHPGLDFALLDPGVLHEHAQPLGDHIQAGPVSSKQKDKELVTSPPNRDVTVSQPVRQGLTNHAQNVIAGLVPER